MNCFIESITEGVPWKYQSDPIDNSWDDGRSGNYWSDYLNKNPLAKNDDVIYDIPYYINNSIDDYDRFPLVDPFEGDYDPSADFTVNATVVFKGEDIRFNFSGYAGNEPASFIWDFGDNSPLSNERNPTHSYISNGTFSISLQVVDLNGDQDYILKNNYIRVNIDSVNGDGNNGKDKSFIDKYFGFILIGLISGIGIMGIAIVIIVVKPKYLEKKEIKKKISRVKENVESFEHEFVSFIFDKMKNQYGDNWWEIGVPESVKKALDDKANKKTKE